MRWTALLLLCAGVALAYALRELSRGGAPQPPAERSAAARDAGGSAAPEGTPAASARRSAAGAAPPATGSNFYYQYVDGANHVQFARTLDEVPPEWRERAGRVALPVPPPPPTAARKRAPRGNGPAVRHAEGTFSAARSAERGPQPDIEIYTTRSCGYCRAALAYMDKRGLAYTNHDIEEEPEAREEYLEKTDGRAGVPVIDIDGEIMQGWNKEHFETLLASMRQ
jgi:glutaredoxin